MKAKKKNRQRTKKAPPNFSVDDLTEAAAVAFANQEVDTAAQLYSSALESQAKLLDTVADPAKRKTLIEQRIHLLEKRAEAKTTLGDPDGARHDYQQALDLHKSTEMLQSDPAWYERSASLHLYIGQTSTGQEAIAAYEQALSILETCLAQCQQVSGTNAVVDDVTQQLAGVCCNAAEVYLTDLCDEPDAEERCETWVQKALSYQVPSSSSSSSDAPDTKKPTVDALQLLANLRISQCRAPEALPAVLEAYQQIEVPCRSLSRLVDISPTAEKPDAAVDERAKELSHVDAVQSLPGFEFRCQMVKIMLEAAAVSETADVAERTASQHAAIFVLGSLMAENDQVVEVWALLGDAFAAIGSNEEAASYYQSALDMLNQLKQSVEDDMQMSTSMEEDDPEADQREDEMQQQLDDVLCQMDDIRRKLTEVMAPTTDETVPMQE